MKNFIIDKKGLLGFKELSYADLGIGTSHQTHIGLYERVLESIDNSDIKSSILIYDNRHYCLDCYFDRIKNPDGSFRSPKIRIGSTDSIVRKIREIARSVREPLYLVWFGLTNGILVFILMSSHHIDFSFFSKRLHSYGVHDITLDIQEYLIDRVSNALAQKD